MGWINELAVEMGSGAMIYVPSFIKIGSGIQKLIGGGYTYRHADTHMQEGELIRLHSFSENEHSRLETLF
jgi:hypothetical protein